MAKDRRDLLKKAVEAHAKTLEVPKKAGTKDVDVSVNDSKRRERTANGTRNT